MGDHLSHPIVVAVIPEDVGRDHGSARGEAIPSAHSRITAISFPIYGPLTSDCHASYFQSSENRKQACTSGSSSIGWWKPFQTPR